MIFLNYYIKYTKNFYASLKKSNLSSVLLCTTMLGVVLGAIHPLVAIFFHYNGFTNKEIGIGMGSYSLATLIMSFFFLPLLRFFSIANLIISSLIAISIIVISYFFISNLYLFFIVRFVNGAFVALIFILVEYWINFLANDRQRGKVLGIYITLLSIGVTMGPIILYFTGMRNFLPFIVVGSIILLAAVSIAYTTKKQNTKFIVRRHVNLWQFLFKVPEINLAAFVFAICETTVIGLYPLYTLGIGYSEHFSSLNLALFTLGNIILQIPIGHICTKKNIKFIICVLTSLSAITFFLMPFFVHKEFIFIGISVIQGGVVCGIYTACLIWLGYLFYGDDLAGINASIGVYYGLGCLVGPLVASVVLDARPIFGLPFFLGTICLIYTLFLIMKNYKYFFCKDKIMLEE